MRLRPRRVKERKPFDGFQIPDKFFENKHGQDSSIPRRRQRPAVLSHHRHRSAQCARRPQHRAPGLYNPVASGKDVLLQLDGEKLKAWVAKGAQMSDKVRWLAKEAGKQAKSA
jgi:hypothetical protein